MTPDTRTFQPDEDALERLRSFLAQNIPGFLGPVLYTKTCLYDSTPDENFILDTVPGFPHIAVGVGAAHAFKFASIIGRILSELVVDGKARYPIDAFKIDRLALLMYVQEAVGTAIRCPERTEWQSSPRPLPHVSS